MQALAVVDHVFLAGAGGYGAGVGELTERGKRGFVGEVILARFHDLAAERPADIGDGGSSDQLDGGVIENLPEAGGGLSLGNFFRKASTLAGSGS